MAAVDAEIAPASAQPNTESLKFTRMRGLLRVLEAKRLPRTIVPLRQVGGTRRVYGCFVVSVAKCPRRCSHARSNRLGMPANIQIMKNHIQPADCAMKPAPDER